MMRSGQIEAILSHWPMILKTLRSDITVPGSPERTLYRIVFEDIQCRYWLLEKIPHHLKHAKREIISLLGHLINEEFGYTLPYRTTTGGEYHVENDNGLWQLVPFINGVSLDRPAYVFDSWRGPCLANCLLSLREASCGFRVPPGRNSFSITDYIVRMAATIARHNPELSAPISPILAYLKKSFFEVHGSLPVSLCHGDYHPLNIIWKSDDIAALIDWEFYGLKPESYDVANMVGCLGMENPDALSGNLVRSFLSTLKAAGFLRSVSWDSLLDLTLAIRFAWLSEWLRKSDTEMVNLELTYMYLLMDNREKIRTLWGI